MNIGLITARGASKGLPRKNILPINDKPLIYWSIRAAIESSCIDAVFVSTEDSEIAELSRQYGASVIDRPLELALDSTSSEPVIAHAIEFLRHAGYQVDNVCLLQPTSPLRTALHIDAAFKLFIEKNADCVLSVFEPNHNAAKAYQLQADGSITGLLFPQAPYCRRQDLPRTYQPNGSIYLFTAASFMLNRQIPRQNVFPFIMSEQESIDIDSLEDFRLAEMIMRGSNE